VRKAEERELNRIIVHVRQAMLDWQAKPRPDDHEVVMTAGEMRLILGALEETEMDADHWMAEYNRLIEEMAA